MKISKKDEAMRDDLYELADLFGDKQLKTIAGKYVFGINHPDFETLLDKNDNFNLNQYLKNEKILPVKPMQQKIATINKKIKQLKKDMVTEIAATLAFSAIQNNDKIGVIFFSDRIEKFIPPKKGRKHILYIIRELIDFQPESRRTNIRLALEYLTNVMKRRCTAFILSDFIDQESFKNALTIANRKHDVVALQVYDRRVSDLPPVGLMRIKDAETGHEQWIDTSSKAVRRAHRDWWINKQTELNDTFTKSNVDSVSVRTDQDYVKALLNLFAKRN